MQESRKDWMIEVFKRAEAKIETIRLNTYL